MRTNQQLYSRPWRRVLSFLMTVVMVFGSQATSFVTDVQAVNNPAPAALTSTITVVAKDAVSGNPITTFKYLINVDNTGTTVQRPDPTTGDPPFECTPADPTYPDNCFWTSMGIASSSPIYTQGDQSDFASSGLTMPDGRYLVSVRADGYKMDGAHFSVPNSGLVTVLMQPYSLPDATIQAAVFEDNAPTNAAPDLPAEHGLAGFVGHISDYIGEVTTDVYGGPLCGTGVCVSKCYVVDNGADIGTVAPDAAGRCPNDPTGLTMIGGGAVPTTATIEGKLKIPNVGPNRYALSIVAPDGSGWIQTTTLEGNHDWDAWVMEGSTGLDTEFVVAGEPFPAIFFGYAKAHNDLTTPKTGQISGVVMATKNYVPTNGGVVGGEPMIGAKMDKPIENPWIALDDLTNGDTAVYVGQGNPDGSFTINNVPDGTYSLSYWDEPQDYIFMSINVAINNGEVTNLGALPIAGWWTTLDGYVFNDLNRNGTMDAGEPGIANFPIAMKKRENSMMDRGAVLVTTDASGHYSMENAYPITQWLVEEAYVDQYYTTGITYQADNQTDPTTVLGQGVDVNVLPVIGLGGRLDWGVHAYAGSGGTPGVDPDNGGIVGTVTYDTTRNELDPKFAVTEDWQPGISGIPVNLYSPIPCGTNSGTACDPTGQYEIAADGSFAKGQLLNSYVTETWDQPTGCIARDMNGNPLVYPTDQQSLPTDPSKKCLEGPAMSVQYGPNAADGNFGATVNGNYGFGDGCYGPGGFDLITSTCADGSDPTSLTPGNYLVDVQIPNDAQGRPMYQVTREEDINIFTGDTFVPQIPPSSCVGPLHTVDVAGVGADGPNAVDNPDFAAVGGSPYEGQSRPLCNTKLVRVSSGRSVAPNFNYFTEVPIPTRFWGLIVDDLNFSTNPKSLAYGEKSGVPFAPVGIYDYTNRLITTVESDYNGLFDVLMTSTNRISCPTPSGVCANLYRFVGNDPGTPNHWNPNYQPQFRTIAAEFEAFPGLIVPADLAPTQVGLTTQLPGTQFSQSIACLVEPTRPQLFAVDKPYAYSNTATTITISGVGFGPNVGQVTLDGVAMPTPSWNDTTIQMSLPVGTALGSHQLLVKSANGLSTVNGLTFHELGSNITMASFPADGVLDNFNNRSNLGGNWSVDNNGVFSVVDNGGTTNDYLRIRTGNNIGNAWWTNGSSFGADQEAYFTFTQVSNQSGANEQGLLLKFSGGNSPSSNNAHWVEVAYNNTPANTLRVRTKSTGSNAITDQLTLTGVTLAANDKLGARALSDGTVIVYKNGTEIGRTTIAATATWTGRIGLRFEGTGTTAATEARVDDFGGGNVTVTTTSYLPNLLEVGPGHTYATIQSALDAAPTGANANNLIVVYPADPSANTNPRLNPLGAYYENLIISAPVKLQGVGPGGAYGDGTFVPGSIIDGAGFGGDTATADAWRAKVASLTWVGNQTVSEGEVIFMVAPTQTTFGTASGSSFKAAIDGFDIRGGDQQGQANILTQGGALFINAYVRNLQVTNNIVEGNSASYGTIRVGTPDLTPASNFNENLRIANNRIFANAGTNLAGSIGIFAGADNYEVASNDICGNFSAEYGGGLSVYGLSPNGKIHDNRIYYNQAYDEGAGVIIAGQLPSSPTILSPGSGPTDIYNNLIEANLANDDGGGLRFLMAGNFPMNIYNNMIVNNVSTHEGGGIGIDDAPNVRIYNNTIAKNMTTATAVTSNGLPAPAGLSTGANSALMRSTFNLPVFSSPLLFNNIFWDNRAGTHVLNTGTVTGLSDAGANVYDLGVADNSGLLNIDASNLIGVDPALVSPFTTALTFSPWRTNPNFVGAILVTMDGSSSMMGDYHIGSGSAAINSGIASLSGVNAPTKDIDGGTRIAPVDRGADEFTTSSSGGGGGSSASFPVTPLLDNFDRANGNVGSNWSGNTSQSIYRIQSNQVQVRDSGTMTWNPTSFGANQEAFFQFADIGAGSEQGVFLKFNGNSTDGNRATFIEAAYYPSSNSIRIWTKLSNHNKALNFTLPGVSFANGDVFGVRAESNGMVTMFQNGSQIGQTNVTQGTNPWTTTLASGGGQIGTWFFGNFNNSNDAHFDNFGGGTMP